MGMREKLIKLLYEAEEQADKRCDGYDNCDKCPAVNKDVPCEEWLKADCLLQLGVTLQRWIPVTERLPEVDGKYLVFESGYIVQSMRVLSFAKDGRKVDKYDFHREWKNVWYRYDSEWGHLTIDSVTHWMPLPDPPKGE